MEGADDPYDILGVERTADEKQIKSAYRKAALKYHPDKQKSDGDKERATQQFAKISNAYEILSDVNQRRQYDLQQDQQGQGFFPSSAGGDGMHSSNNDDHYSGFDHSDFFSNFRRGHGGFHDPFQVFERVFREEFGNSATSARTTGGRNSFHDDFMMGGGIFDRDPFFGGSSFRDHDPYGGGRSSRHQGGGHDDSLHDPFSRGGFGGGGLFGDMFASMRHMEKQMDEMARQQQAGGGGGNNNGNNGNYYYSSSSTSSSFPNRNGESVTTQTTTRMINGKQQTVTERIVRKADGTVDRQVETTGDEDFGRAAIAADQDHTPAGLLPWKGKRRASKGAKDKQQRRDSRTKHKDKKQHTSPHDRW